VLGEVLTHLEELAAGLTRVGERSTEEVATNADPFVPEAIKLLDSIPGIGERAAQISIAEMGVDMSQFPSAAHLSSWAGMCPGNNESAGKRRSGQTTKGNKQLRTALVEAAWVASRVKGSLLAAKSQRLVKRMGKKKALVAVGHTI
jgi:transposase